MVKSVALRIYIRHTKMEFERDWFLWEKYWSFAHSPYWLFPRGSKNRIYSALWREKLRGEEVH
jgi:hypothetical protein